MYAADTLQTRERAVELTKWLHVATVLMQWTWSPVAIRITAEYKWPCVQHVTYRRAHNASVRFNIPKFEQYPKTNSNKPTLPCRILLENYEEILTILRNPTTRHLVQNSVSLKLHGYTVHQTMLKPFHYQMMHTMLKNTESLKHSKITLQHVSVYAETIFRELQSVLG